MTVSLEAVARVLGTGREEALRRALRALLVEELRRVRAEKASIVARYRGYGVRGFADLLRLVEEDVVSNVDVEDLTRLDYLEYRERRLLSMLRELEG